MNRLIVLLFALAIIAIGAGAAWYLIDTRNSAFGTPLPPPVPAAGLDEGLAIYTNGPYGFSVFYPEQAEVSYAFDETYHLGTGWRANALPDSAGAPIVAIIPYAVRSDDSYPRYFNAMVRIGASDDPREIARCTDTALEQGEVALPDRSISGRDWKAFSFESAGMMQYARGVSYRTLSEGKCIALEQVQTGSIYKEDVRSERDIPDEVLQAEYEKLEPIIESFTFAR